jgi:hypothetical protein
VDHAEGQAEVRCDSAKRAAFRTKLSDANGIHNSPRPAESFPLARAFRNPAFTRSTIKDRSSSATAPRIVNAILPVGVDVSISRPANRSKEKS